MQLARFLLVSLATSGMEAGETAGSWDLSTADTALTVSVSGSRIR